MLGDETGRVGATRHYQEIFSARPVQSYARHFGRNALPFVRRGNFCVAYDHLAIPDAVSYHRQGTSKRNFKLLGSPVVYDRKLFQPYFHAFRP